MTLCFETGFVHEDPRIGVETRKSEADVGVDEGDFRGRDARVLQFHRRALLAAEDDNAVAFDGDGAGAAFDGFEGIFDLENVAIGGEDCRLLVRWVFVRCRGRS